MQDFAAALAARQKQSLYRHRRVLESAQSVCQRVDGKQLLSFSSNDYLGLAADPRLVSTFQKAASQYGVGSGSSHLINGHSAPHHALEIELAEFTGRDRALLFSTGYMANLGVLTALLKRDDKILGDKLMHASLIDAAALSAAKLQRFPHNDISWVARKLREQGSSSLVVTEGVFSMDGDSPDLATLAGHCQKHDAWLMVDDAHGLGVLGDTGAGSCQAQGLGQDEVPILMGTLGKALGCFGAFVAGSEDMIETLIQHARSYIYTTALPSAVAEASRTALQICQQEAWRREHLQSLTNRFRREAITMGLQLVDSATPIQPILLGDGETALSWQKELQTNGIYAVAIRPPTVPEGQARLRISFSANHTEDHLDELLQALLKVSNKFST